MRVKGGAAAERSEGTLDKRPASWYDRRCDGLAEKLRLLGRFGAALLSASTA